MKEIVIISGKGGTGKTSLTASFALLADRPVIADCDVDAANLHLVLAPEGGEMHEFFSGEEAVIRTGDCTGCGICLERCRFDAIVQTPDGGCAIDPYACEGCGVCVRFCPEGAIDLSERRCGEWAVSETRAGPMVHARLGIAAENSGKLVSTVRREAHELAERESRQTVLIDGPPGIGCPVIASLAGATLALVVTEPTVAGEHDLLRVLELTEHFNIRTAVCVNKWDLNPGMTERIECRARAKGAINAGRIGWDSAFTGAMIQGRTVVETGTQSATEIRNIWNSILHLSAQ